MRLFPLQSYFARRRDVAALRSLLENLNNSRASLEILTQFSKRAVRSQQDTLRREYNKLKKEASDAVEKNFAGIRDESFSHEASLARLSEKQNSLEQLISSHAKRDAELRQLVEDLQGHQVRFTLHETARLHVEFVRQNSFKFQQALSGLDRARINSKSLDALVLRQKTVSRDLLEIELDIVRAWEVEEHIENATQAEQTFREISLPETAYWRQLRCDALAALDLSRKHRGDGDYSTALRCYDRFTVANEKALKESEKEFIAMKASASQWLEVGCELPAVLRERLEGISETESAKEALPQWEGLRTQLIDRATRRYEKNSDHNYEELQKQVKKKKTSASDTRHSTRVAIDSSRWIELEHYAKLVAERVNQQL